MEFIMEVARKTEYFQALSKELEKYTADTLLSGDEESGQWLQRAVFATSAELESFVMTEATMFAAREDVDLLEIFVKLFPEADCAAVDEVNNAFAELNYYSPVGSFGIHPVQGYGFLRECFVIDGAKELSAMIADAILNYELVLETVVASYPGLSAIWSGERTFDEVIEKGWIKKHSK